ncbi:MAG: hypothetical protein DI498_10415, partial [Paracoccus denitrificans]
MNRQAAILTIALLATPLAVSAQGVRPTDQERLTQIDTALGEGIRQALAEGGADSLSPALSALQGAALPNDQISVSGLAGDWNCSVIKLGGILGIVSYPPFKCRIGADGSFAKLTGSQLTKGSLQVFGDIIVYTGTSYVQGDTPVPYASFADDIDTNATQILPDVGLLEVVSPDRARILATRELVQA